MTNRDQLASPVMSARACFHRNQTRRQLSEKREQLASSKASA
ncbi:hypothetical protein AOX55_00004413 (plasmid) [Sinorhizobium fredii CCBAU 25509]|nr:hypothetical protein AOX55_00004413 [Sinorhizobium fredii CCBAU 25509]